MYIGPHRIDTPYFLAPMAGVSEMPFRVLAFEYGAGLATTELISAKGLFHRNARTQQYLTFDKARERPFSLQLFGGEEESMAQAAIAAVEHGAQIIDINMGCPVKKVTKTGAGSSLLCDPKRAASLVRKMREAVADAVPITAKIRSGWDSNALNYIEMGKALEDAGCAALAMHARSRAQGYSGKADWSAIAQLKAALRIPVIGNGDVNMPRDALKMQNETGCDAVMIGRGALGNPWLFYALKHGLPDFVPSAKEKHSLVKRHLKSHIDFHGDDNSPLRAIRSFRSHLVWYSRGLRDASLFRELVMQIDDENELHDNIDRFFLTQGDDTRPIADEFDSIDYRQAFG
jgi:nifR3 family TIM-barrel protein